MKIVAVVSASNKSALRFQTGFVDLRHLSRRSSSKAAPSGLLLQVLEIHVA